LLSVSPENMTKENGKVGASNFVGMLVSGSRGF
jgi:hypothetical protein